MLNVVYFIIGLCITGVALGAADSVAPTPGNFIVLCTVASIIFLIWGGAILCGISEMTRKQLKDKYNLPVYKKRKESYKAEMTAYKNEMQKELLEKYRQFEETLMGGVKDSKLIAAVLKQSGYSTVLDCSFSIFCSWNWRILS